MSQLRLLQVVASTDPDPDTTAALDLHGSLVAAGIEVRTLAMAPGRRGGLDSHLPVMAPSRRSFAARSGVLGEERWADVVAFHGMATLTVGAWPARRSTVRLLHFAVSPSMPKGPTGRLARVIARRADLITTGADVDAPSVAAALAVSVDAQRRVRSVEDWLVLLSALRPEQA